MNLVDELTVNGHRYATERAARAARAEQERVATKLAESRARQAREFEAGLRAKFLNTGASEDDWNAQKSTILAEARKHAALTGQDTARRESAQRYRGLF